MSYFNQDFIDFLMELTKNNNREWFHENKKRYGKSVKQPFAGFVEEMIARIQSDDSRVMIAPKDAIFRINRDIRFTKDKTPYKTQVSALISPAGKKDKIVPGFYFEFAPDEIRVYGGAYSPDKHRLHSIRSCIAGNPDEFNRVISDKKFTEMFGELVGEKHKRLPPEFKAAAETQSLLFNKQLYYGATFDSKELLSNKLPDILMEYYYAAKPMKEFLEKAMGF